MAGAMMNDTSSKCVALLLPIEMDITIYLPISEMDFSVMMSFQDRSIAVCLTKLAPRE